MARSNARCCTPRGLSIERDLILAMRRENKRWPRGHSLALTCRDQAVSLVSVSLAALTAAPAICMALTVSRNALLHAGILLARDLAARSVGSESGSECFAASKHACSCRHEWLYGDLGDFRSVSRSWGRPHTHTHTHTPCRAEIFNSGTFVNDDPSDGAPTDARGLIWSAIGSGAHNRRILYSEELEEATKSVQGGSETNTPPHERACSCETGDCGW